MDAISFRFASLILLGLTLLGGAACGPTSGAAFNPTTGVLTVTGTANADLYVVSVVAGAIVVNGGQVQIRGGVPTVANTVRIEMRGKEGADFLELDEGGGALPDGLLIGGYGADVLVGGSGDDTVDGGDGDDVALLGDGDDTFVWRDGDDFDTVEGEAGADTLVSNGSSADEQVELYADAGRVVVHRQAGAVTTDLGGVESIEWIARAGADSIVVGDLSGTAATRIRVDLQGVDGFGDASADAVMVNATQGDDAFGFAGDASLVQGFGLAANVQIVGGEVAYDRLTATAQAGADAIDASGLEADAIPLVANGGLGVDVFTGGAGNDLFNGGDGNDQAFLGDGDDGVVWNPGDDNDTIVGEAGFDALVFNGAAIGEIYELFPVAGRVQLFRNVASVVLDLDDLEAVDFAPRSGNDIVVVHDLSTTDLVEVNANLTGSSGTPDGIADSVFVSGTGLDDTVQVVGDAGTVGVFGLHTTVHIENAEIGFDGLTVSTYAGDDVVHAAALSATGINLTADGGDDDDVLIGGAGADVLYGGEGDDLLQGGPGLDVLDGGPGSNIVLQ